MHYFTVEWSSAFSGGPRYEHVAVTEGGQEATQLVMNRIKSASMARVVREIDHAEFHRLTGDSDCCPMRPHGRPDGWRRIECRANGECKCMVA